MPKKVKTALQYLLIIAIMVVLVWISLRNIDTGENGQGRLEFILNVWDTANKPLLLLSGVLLVVSHVVRAERWKLLLDPLGNKLSLTDGFLSVMIGYFVNLVIPRGGEISRCLNLYKLNDTPVPRSIGTVVAERVVDMFFLLAFIGIAFIIELDNLTYFFSTLDFSGGDTQIERSFNPYLVYGGGVLFLLIIIGLIWLFVGKSRAFRLELLQKVRHFLTGIRQGLLVVFRLEKKYLFIFYSFSIWFLYYLMSYCVITAFPETNELGLLATLTIFAIGGIAMAVPLPGGTGSYHVLVPGGLVLLYGLAEDKAVAFTFIFHGWQTLLVIIVGALSLLVSQYRIRKRSGETDR